MSLFGRGPDPELVKALLSSRESQTWEINEPPSGALDKVREEAWDECAKEAFYAGDVGRKKYVRMLDRNPYRDRK